MQVLQAPPSPRTSSRDPIYADIDKIEQIDRLLKAPIESLVALTERSLSNKADPLRGTVGLPLYFPPWVASDRDCPRRGLNVTSAICCSTLQRLWRRKRRFPEMEETFERLAKVLEANAESSVPDLLANAESSVPDLLARAFLPSELGKDESVYVRFLQTTKLLGPQNPWLACETLWTLINAGEGQANRGAGHLALFGMLWSLLRRFPDRFSAGASVGLAPPTAYLTARCLMPIHTLCQARKQRAKLLENISRVLGDIDKMVQDPESGRELPFKLDYLATALCDYSQYSLAGSSFRECAEAIKQRASRMDARSEKAGVWREVIELLAKTLQALGVKGKSLVDEAAPVVADDGILPRICRALEARNTQALEKLGVDAPSPEFRKRSAEERFWAEHGQASRQALALCGAFFKNLQTSCEPCASLSSSASIKEIQDCLQLFADANRRVAEMIAEAVQDSVQWCESVMLREIAHASAGNFAEFDPAELVNALAVVVGAGKIDSPLRLTDAVEKALRGVLKDGSWMPGHPFAMDEQYGMGAFCPTSGIVWMLSGTISRHGAVIAADAALEQYVDWLDGTRRLIGILPGDRSPREQPLRITGWVSERMARPDRIDLWNTAYAINSLLNIRGLKEFRLMEACERRFTVLSGGRRLSELEAVDMGARHEHRLHCRLAEMARRIEGNDYATADYAVVLHGPPGSSKTAVAQAVAKEMWREAQQKDRAPQRLIRITPADFTRGGEARIDWEARVIFDLLRHVRNATILFDEIDDLLRERKPGEPSFLKLVVPAMLNRLQDLRDACARQEIFFMLATNYVDRIEPALIRRGRFDRAIPIVYPDRESRISMVETRAGRLRAKKNGWAAGMLGAAFGGDAIKETDYWPWMSVNTLLKEAAEDLARWEPDAVKARPEKKQEIEEQAKGRIEALLAKYKSSFSSVPYIDRLRDSKTCSELREEFLHYMFSPALHEKDYSDGLKGLLKAGDGADDLMERGTALWNRQGRVAAPPRQ